MKDSFLINQPIEYSLIIIHDSICCLNFYFPHNKTEMHPIPTVRMQLHDPNQLGLTRSL